MTVFGYLTGFSFNLNAISLNESVLLLQLEVATSSSMFVDVSSLVMITLVFSVDQLEWTCLSHPFDA